MLRGMLLVSAAAVMTLAGCAAVQSEVVKGGDQIPDGAIYFMPRRPFVVTVTTPAATTAIPSPPTTVVVSQGTAEADISQQFALSQGTNWLAKNEMNISVGANGLLKSSNSTASSEVATALQNLASAAGAITGLASVGAIAVPLVPGTPAQPPPVDGCPVAGTSYQYLLYPGPRSGDPNLTTYCGYTVTWHMAAGYVANANNSRFTPGSSYNSGIFYKHELPYLVFVTGPKDKTGNSTVAITVLTSPDESKIGFFPVKRSFFSNNTANVSLTDGVLTGVDQTTDGELTAALSLPATVITSYTSAIGNMLGSLTTNSGDLQKLLAQQQATSNAQAQETVCKITIANNPMSGLTGTDLTKALTAISTACGASH